MHPKEATRGEETGRIQGREAQSSHEWSQSIAYNHQSCGAPERMHGAIFKSEIAQTNAVWRASRRRLEEAEKVPNESQSDRRRQEIISHRKYAQERGRRASEKVLEVAGRNKEADTWPPGWYSNWPS
ncbi:hypothetical protein B0H14DRAFT_2555159 [Mycena olivaceomarginata]|nr:hypothetical protein B0H14DRAFT_2555159 [Mycena olivaceomarginata]